MRNVSRNMNLLSVLYGLVVISVVNCATYRDEADIEKEITKEVCINGFSMECLNRVWLQAGCYQSGSNYPENADDDQLFWWRVRDMPSVRIDMERHYEYALQDLDDYRYKCFGDLNEDCGYEAVPGHALYGQNEKTLLDAEPVQCRTECSRMREGCRSFDYNNNTRLCFLSSLNRDTAPDAFGAHASFTYYEKLCGDAHAPSHVIESHVTTDTLSGTVHMYDGLCYVKYGPVGDVGGFAFTDQSMARQGNITGLRVRHDTMVNALQFEYGGKIGDRRGGRGGKLDVFLLEHDEYITSISGRAGMYLESITLTTNKQTLGPFGRNTYNEAFKIKATGRRLAYISGRYSGLIDKLFFHFTC